MQIVSLRQETQCLVEALRLAKRRAGGLDRVDDRGQVTSHLLPPTFSLAACQLVDAPHQVDQTRERSTGVHVERTRSE